MSIRKAELTDAVEIRNLVFSLAHFFLEDGNESLPLWLDDSLKISSFEKRLTEQEYTNFVYLRDAEIVGYISILNGNHIYYLFVSEKFQGRGIARKLWDHAKSELPVTSYTVRSSIFATPIYESFGFKITEPASIKEGVHFQVMKKP